MKIGLSVGILTALMLGILFYIGFLRPDFVIFTNNDILYSSIIVGVASGTFIGAIVGTITAEYSRLDKTIIKLFIISN